MDVDEETDEEAYKGMIPSRLNNYIPMPDTWSVTDPFTLILNVFAQPGNYMEDWWKYRHILISKEIESDRIDAVIQGMRNKVLKYEMELVQEEEKIAIPQEIQDEISECIKVEPRIYMEYWGTTDDQAIEYGSQMTPEPDSPFERTGYKGWKRAFWEEDKKDAIREQLKSGTGRWIENDNPYDDDYRE